jgi:adenylosuccinate synthase
MPITVIVGGQYGSEGKGKVAHCLAIERSATIAVRTGGPNAGHTVIDPRNRAIVLRQLPTAAIIPDVKCVLGPGSYIDPDLLLREVATTSVKETQLLIDPNAMVVTSEDKEDESSNGLKELIGSTQSGTGAAVLKRIARKAVSHFAKNDSRLSSFIQPVAPILRDELSRGARVILEGTQGFGLSVLHSETYPFVTSRDTTAAGFVSEVGLSPLDVDEVVMVIRAFPIRVSGNSGPLPNEINWDTITIESGSPHSVIECTSVTQKIRRVARFDPRLVRSAITVNAPTAIVLNHLDYVDYQCRTQNSLSTKAARFVRDVEDLIGSRIQYFGFSPSAITNRESHFEFTQAIVCA